MEFGLTEEQTAIQDMATRFARDRLAPLYQQHEDDGGFTPGLAEELGGLGLLGAELPTEYGGSGVDSVTAGVIMEQLGWGDINFSYLPLLVSLLGDIVVKFAAPDLAARVVPKLCSGEEMICLGLTEPGGGSDAANLRLTARRDGDDYIINGAKTYITNGSFADFIVLAVRTGEAGHGGISLVLFPTDTPGFTVGRKLDKLGTRSVDSSELHFEDCRIPRRNLLGHENAGFIYIMTNFQGERLVAALLANTGMELSLRDAIQYGNERTAFGRPIMKFQVWKHTFAEHLTALAASKALTHQAVQALNTLPPQAATKIVSQAKLFSSDLAQKVTYDCLQFHGGYGFIEEYDICRQYRDVRLLPIGGGTSEVMKEIIWKMTELGA